MGDWAEWMKWADWLNAITQTQLHFPSSFKVFQHVDKSKSTLFSFVRDQCGTKKVLFHFHISSQSVTSDNKKVLSCVALVVPNGKKVLSHFSTCWKALNEELKYSCVCVIAFFQSAHCTHSAQSPIYGEVGHDAAVASCMGEKVIWAQLCVVVGGIIRKNTIFHHTRQKDEISQHGTII